MTIRRNSENKNGATLIVNEEELEYLWHKINCGDSHTFNDYKKTHTMSEIVNGYDLFCDLNRKYTPEGQ